MLGEVPTHAPLSLTARPFSSIPAQNTLREISEWLENLSQEVVILACRNLEGMMEGPAQGPDGLHQEHLWEHAVSPWGEQGPQAPSPYSWQWGQWEH